METINIQNIQGLHISARTGKLEIEGTRRKGGKPISVKFDFGDFCVLMKTINDRMTVKEFEAKMDLNLVERFRGITQ